MTTLQQNLTNKINIELVGEPIDSKSMDVTVVANGVEVVHVTNLIGKHQVEFFQSYPMVIQITVTGKGPNDTQVDSNGRITGDKHVLISNLHISGIPVKNWMLEKCVVEFDHRNTNYLGTNGTATICLPKSDAIENHFYLLAMSNNS